MLAFNRCHKSTQILHDRQYTEPCDRMYLQPLDRLCFTLAPTTALSYGRTAWSQLWWSSFDSGCAKNTPQTVSKLAKIQDRCRIFCQIRHQSKGMERGNKTTYPLNYWAFSIHHNFHDSPGPWQCITEGMVSIPLVCRKHRHDLYIIMIPMYDTGVVFSLPLKIQKVFILTPKYATHTA